jgi:hypothetical protein
LEPPFAILIASLPAMTPLVDRLLTRLGIHTYKSSYQNGYPAKNPFVKIDKGTNNSEYPMSNLSTTHDKNNYSHQHIEAEDTRHDRTEYSMGDKLNMQHSKVE